MRIFLNFSPSKRALPTCTCHLLWSSCQTDCVWSRGIALHHHQICLMVIQSLLMVALCGWQVMLAQCPWTPWTASVPALFLPGMSGIQVCSTPYQFQVCVQVIFKIHFKNPEIKKKIVIFWENKDKKEVLWRIYQFTIFIVIVNKIIILYFYKNN